MAATRESTTSKSTSTSPFHFRFLGVRGSIPAPAVGNLGIGGNTACVEVVSREDADETLIFDAGTGIRALGDEILARARMPRAIHIFFTHFHWDHIQGLPYFHPLFSAECKLIFHSFHTPERLHEVLAAQMQAPYFPVLFDEAPAHVEFRQIGAQPERFGELSIAAFPLHHPQGSVGYRVVQEGKTAIYATDHEHGDAERDRELIAKAEDADLLVYDAQYTPAEYETRHGWGHSTWLEATCIARKADVKQLVLFHHDPGRDDEAVRGIELEARKEFPATHAAYEGLRL